jgi:hypothetical protein
MYNKSQDLLLIEQNFQSIKDKRNIDSSLDTIRRVISRMSDLDVSISIVDNKTNNFFGMTMYPNKSTMDKLIESIMEDRSTTERIMDVWMKNKNWIIEIDSILLYDTNLNANPAEIVAVLLHEIGHTVYSNTIPARVTKVIKSELLNLDYKLRALCKKSQVNKIFELAIVEACGQKIYTLRNQSNEFDADKFVVKQGYGNELHNFLDKVIKSQSASKFIQSEGERDKEIEITVKWAIDNVSELRMRKTKLKHTMDVQIYKTPSIFIKTTLRSIRDLFIKDTESIFKSAVAEQVLLRSHDKIIQESILSFFDKIGKIKKVNKADIDVIEIELDRMANEDDKIYMLDRVYDQLEIVNMGIELIDTGKGDRVAQSKNTLLGFQKRLEKIRDVILRAKVNKRQYGVFLQYPEGYEG